MINLLGLSFSFLWFFVLYIAAIASSIIVYGLWRHRKADEEKQPSTPPTLPNALNEVLRTDGNCTVHPSAELDKKMSERYTLDLLTLTVSRKPYVPGWGARDAGFRNYQTRSRPVPEDAGRSEGRP